MGIQWSVASLHDKRLEADAGFVSLGRISKNQERAHFRLSAAEYMAVGREVTEINKY